MIKFRLYYDKDKEEKFLNDMVSKGYAMTRFFLGIYWFEKCERGEYTYQIDLIYKKNTQQLNEYYDLIRETGGELVQVWGFWAFFRKKGPFELYTDIESQIEQYRKIRNLFLILGFSELCISFSQWSNFFINGIKGFFVTGILISLLFIVLLHQAYQCNKKIQELRERDK